MGFNIFQNAFNEAEGKPIEAEDMGPSLAEKAREEERGKMTAELMETDDARGFAVLAFIYAKEEPEMFGGILAIAERKFKGEHTPKNDLLLSLLYGLKGNEFDPNFSEQVREANRTFFAER